MGWKSRYIRSLVSPPKKRTPKSKPAMTTVSGLTHRLTWVDRHAGYRMRCTCGWIDPTRRTSEARAVTVANAHVRGIQRAVAIQDAAVRRARRNAVREGWTLQQRRASVIRRGVASIVLVGTAGVGAALIVHHVEHPGSYDDGANWATGASDNPFDSIPGCGRYEMVTLAHEPNDNYAPWRAGCLSVPASIDGGTGGG
jgi:hypothetical protein